MKQNRDSNRKRALGYAVATAQPNLRAKRSERCRAYQSRLARISENLRFLRPSGTLLPYLSSFRWSPECALDSYRRLFSIVAAMLALKRLLSDEWRISAFATVF